MESGGLVAVVDRLDDLWSHERACGRGVVKHERPLRTRESCVSTLTLGDDALQCDEAAKVNTPQCPWADCVLSEATFEADVECVLLDESVVFFCGSRVPDDVEQSCVEWQQVFVRFVEKSCSEFPIVRAQDVNGDDETLLAQANHSLDRLLMIDRSALHSIN